MLNEKAAQVVRSFNNHIHISYGPNKNFGYQAGDSWNFQHGTSVRECFDWRSECVLTLQQIYKSVGQKKLAVYYDGTPAALTIGMLLHLNRIPFRFIAAQFENGLNENYLKPLTQFCEFHKISFELINFNAEKFLKDPNTHKKANSYRTDDFRQLLAMEIWAQDSVRFGFTIFPFGLTQIEKTQEGWKIVEHEKDYALMRFQVQMGGVGLANFYKWSPELMNSFLQDQQVKAVFTDSVDGQQLFQNQNFKFFKSYMPIPEYRTMNGFEELENLTKEFLTKFNSKLENKFKAYVYNYQDYSNALETKGSRIKTS